MTPALLISTFSFGYSAVSFVATAEMLSGSSIFSSTQAIPGFAPGDFREAILPPPCDNHLVLPLVQRLGQTTTDAGNRRL